MEVEAASLDRELEVADSRLSPADIKVISNFYEWLQTIDGGLKAHKTAVLYRKSSKMILSNLGGLKSLKRYGDLGRDGGYFEGLIEKGVAPGTVKAFLMGMQAFASCHGWGVIPNMTPADATAMKLTAQRWHASTSKVGAGRRQDVKASETLILQDIEPKINAALEEGVTTANAIKILADPIMDGFTNAEFLLTRNYLILYILNMTGHRTGIILNALISEYHALALNQDGSVTMFVTNHKTYAEYGAMPIKLGGDLRMYVNHYLARRGAICKDDTYLFCKVGGTQLVSVDVCRALQDMASIPQLTPTRLRKLRATKVTYLTLSHSLYVCMFSIAFLAFSDQYATWIDNDVILFLYFQMKEKEDFRKYILSQCICIQILCFFIFSSRRRIYQKRLYT